MAYGKKSIKTLEVGDILTAAQAFTNAVAVPMASYTKGQQIGVVTKIDVDFITFRADGKDQNLKPLSVQNGQVSYRANPLHDYPKNPDGSWLERNSGWLQTGLGILGGIFAGKASATVNDGNGNTTSVDGSGNVISQNADDIAKKEAAAAATKKRNTIGLVVAIILILGLGGTVVYFVSKAKKKVPTPQPQPIK